MRTDASEHAIGAVLEQDRLTVWVPGCFFSRKLTPSQMNWTPREKEAYAVVASLVKWAGWIGVTQVTVVTDHKTLESWVREYPSGPTRRRARWHEIFSQFTLTVVWQPGKTNVPADAMTRYAYPASQGRQDVCMHGTAEAADLVHQMAWEEEQEGRNVDGLSVGAIMQRDQEAYRLVPLVREQALLDVGVLPEWVQVDMFASRHNACHPTHITAQMDAFTFSWDKLLVEDHHVLWANPPLLHAGQGGYQTHPGAHQDGVGDT